MSLQSGASLPGSAAAEYNARRNRAICGGSIMLLGSLIVSAIATWDRRDGSSLFFWLTTAWLVFPVGAYVEDVISRRVAGRGWIFSLGVGLYLGLISGGLLSLGVWVFASHSELIGLISNRDSGGYASYSASVRRGLAERAWIILKYAVPFAAVWVGIWSGWTACRHRPASSPAPDSNCTVRLRPGAVIGQVMISLVIGYATVAALAITYLMILNRGLSGMEEIRGLAPYLAGAVVIGPWIGPIANPGGGTAPLAWRLTAVALPVLLAAVAPLVVWRRPVPIRIAVALWCGLMTSILFWSALGLVSFLSSI